MKTKKKINPSAAVPQAPLALRAGTKTRAEAPPAATPDKQKAEEGDDDPDDPDEEPDDPEDARAAHDAKMDDASAKHRAAADAADAAKGTDSASALQAYEDAHDEAMEAGGSAKQSCMSLRGAEPGPDSQPAPAPPPAPGAASALSALAGASAAAQLDIAAKAKTYEEIARIFSTATFDKTILAATAAHASHGEVAKVRAEQKKATAAAEMSERVGLLAAAVHAGMDRAKAFNIGKDGSLGAPLAVWTRGSVADLRDTLTTMGFAPGAAVTTSTLIVASADGGAEAGLSARAEANGVPIEIQRAAEANRSKDR